MKTKINVLFYLRKSKVNNIGKIPVFLRITINGKRIDKSTGCYVDESKWAAEHGKMKGNSEEARSINSQLEIIKASIFETEKSLFMRNFEVNHDTFKSLFLGTTEKPRTLIPIF